MLKQLAVPSTRALPTEMNAAREWRADFLGEAADGRIFHVEIQSGPHPAMATRMLEYNARLRRALEDRAKKDGSPVPKNVEIVLIVLIVASEPWGPVEGILAKGLRLTCDVIDAIDMDPGPLLRSEDLSDAIFALLCRGGTEPEAIRAVLRRVMSEQGSVRQDAFVRLLVIAKLRNASRLVHEEIENMSITIDFHDIQIVDIGDRNPVAIV